MNRNQSTVFPSFNTTLCSALTALVLVVGSTTLVGCDPGGGEGRPVGTQAWKRVDFDEKVRTAWADYTAGHELEGTEVVSVGDPMETDGKIYVTVVAKPAEGESVSQVVTFSGAMAEWTIDPLNAEEPSAE